MTIDGTPTAFQYSYIYANKLYNHSVGFDPAWGKYRVGNVLQFMATEAAIEKKLTEYDFLRGTEEYKYHWTKTVHKSVDIVIWRSNYICALAKIEKLLRRAVNILMPKTIALFLYNRLFGRKEDKE